MNRFSSLKWRLRRGLSLAWVIAVLYPASVATVIGADSKPESDAKSEKKAAPPEKADAASSDKKAKPAPRTISGAELYSMHCNRCHPERYPTERTAAQWKTILMHMRVRANLPAEQARTILKYLQDNSGR
ncbi:MAG: hypothetical protein QOJ40_2953 [Verrucomicrobiota bacterium]